MGTTFAVGLAMAVAGGVAGWWWSGRRRKRRSLYDEAPFGMTERDHSRRLHRQHIYRRLRAAAIWPVVGGVLGWFAANFFHLG